MNQKNYKDNLNDNSHQQFIYSMNTLRKRLENINESNRLDILMHMLLSKGVFDLINNRKGIIVNTDDYAQLTKDDYIQTAENILSELKFFEDELDGLIN